MKRIVKDENGFPLNYDPSKYYTTPEKMIEIPPYLYNTTPGQYYATTWGRIYNSKTNTYLPKRFIRDYNDYIRIILWDINGNELNISVHIIIANIFIPFYPVVPEGKEIYVNHKDGVKWHNEPYNLEWVTQSENTMHADRTGLIARPYGEDNGASVLTDEQYRKICELTQQGYKAYQINKIMDIGYDITNIAQKIRNGKSETLIAEEYDFSNIPKNDYRKFTEDQVRYICICLQDHPEMKPAEILISMGYNLNQLGPEKTKKLRDTISTIKRRVSYIEIGKDYNF